MNLTELLAIPVIHLPTATRRGVVSAFGVDARAKRVVHVVVIDEESLNEVCYRWQDIRHGQDVMLTVADPIEDTVPQRIPFRSNIYDTDGKDYGYLKEISCTAKGRIEGVLTTLDEALEPTRLMRMGDVVLLRGQKRLPQAAHQKSSPIETAPIQTDASGLMRIAGDYGFLVGRTIHSDLIQEGRLVLRQGSVIDEETIEMARSNGLLLTLTVLSR